VETLKPACIGNSSKEHLYIMEHVDRDNIGICFDSNHLLTEDNIEFLKTAGQYVITTHLSDYDGVDEKHWYPGRGINDWRRIVKVLEEKGYTGPWVFETGFQGKEALKTLVDEWESLFVIPRPEHPNPQCERTSWMNLNGRWDFEFDFGASGMDRKFYENPDFHKKIVVPFCPESELSGIGYKDFIPCCWYRRFFDITKEQIDGTVYLNFGAVDYETHVFVNKKKVGVHRGGYSSFRLDITSAVLEGENEVIVCVYDDTRSGRQPRGKQSHLYHSQRCEYTRTTGICRQYGWNLLQKHTLSRFGITRMWKRPV